MNQLLTFSMVFRTYALAALIIVWAGGLTAWGDHATFSNLVINAEFSPTPPNNTFQSGGIDFTVISGPDAEASEIATRLGTLAELPVSGTHLFFNSNVGVAVSLAPSTGSLSFFFGSTFSDVTLNVNGDSVFVDNDLLQLDGTTIGDVLITIDSFGSANPFDQRGILRLEGEINSFAITGTELAFDDLSFSESFGQAAGLIRNFVDPTPDAFEGFGGSVAIDGNHVLVGSGGDDTNGFGVGQAYLFDAATGNLIFTFDDPTPTDEIFDVSGDGFGSSVAINGNHVLIGAPGDDTIGPLESLIGQAHLFDATTGNLVFTFDDPTPTTRDGFGGSVAIDGNHVLVGAPGHDINGNSVGQAHLFDATTGNLLFTFDDPTPTTFDQFGSSVAIDGNHILIGASGDDTSGFGVGQAHLFDATTGNLIFTFDDPTPSPRDRFGDSVAIDGNHVLVGAIFDDTIGPGFGQAHLFDATTGNLISTFDDPTPNTSDFFGSTVAIDGNHVLVGAIFDDTIGSDVGQAHLFDATTGNLVFTFDDPTPTGRDSFTRSLAIDGDHVVVGAPGDDTNGPDFGQVSLFSFLRPISGDFDGDRDVDGDDVDFYIGNLSQAATAELAQLDLNGDGEVTIADHDLHVMTLVVTSNGVTGALRGDVNLDGTVDVISDGFALVGNLGMSVTSRSQGDLNADGMVTVLGDGFRLFAELGQSNEE